MRPSFGLGIAGSIDRVVRRRLPRATTYFGTRDRLLSDWLGSTMPSKKKNRTESPSAPLADSVPGSQGPRVRSWILMGALALLVAAIYHPAMRYGFVDLDDDVYFIKNHMVSQGLTMAGVEWAFTTYAAANWHPLTWLSLMLDATLFGKDGFGPHLTNIVLHACNVLLVFALFRRMTGALWRSAFVAALFATHPMHVESVAWVSERKDVLSMFFGLLAIWHYARNQPAPRFLDHIMVALFMALSLMAKPMLVTLPFLLLLLDHWPLRRTSMPGLREWLHGSTVLKRFGRKLPLLVIAGASSVVTVIAQEAGGAIQRLETLTLGERLQNVAVAYAAYLRKVIAPVDLCAFYPLASTGIPIGRLLLSLTVLGLFTWGVIRLGRTRPYLLTGWLWYLGALVPVIGLVQVGSQAMADRYGYLPFLGLYVIIAWGLGDLVRRFPSARFGTILACCLSVFALAAVASKQVRYWKDSVSLFGRALAVTTNNALAEGNYGMAIGRLGRHDEAMHHLARALLLWPEFFDARYNLGVALATKGQYEDAIEQYRAALMIKPGRPEVHLNMATALGKTGRFDEALSHLDSVLVEEPENPAAHVNIGMIHLHRQQLPEAIMHLELAVKNDPRSVEALNNLGLALELAGRTNEAILRYRSALRMAPSFRQARQNLDRVERKQAFGDSAVQPAQAP